MVKDKKFNQLRATFVETLEDLVKFRGNDPMQARIFAMVVLSPEPLTQEKIAKKTGYSRSQISRYLANLEQRQMVSKESMPGSRTQLYGGDAIPFLDGFRSALDTAERFLKGRIEIVDHILSEWKSLPDAVRKTNEAKKLNEVVSVFSAWFGSYLDLLTDFNQRFDERLKELERDILLMKF
ncbi:MAG: MarR family transcriptional regulator [Candidatus Thorarchaeota archaeon]|jgi:DNA-binding transcriptional regulator GbsR (MarR family)